MHVLNSSSRQWVFGDPATPFIIPAGPSRVVEVPERLSPDAAKEVKFRKILEAHLTDPNSGLKALPADGSITATTAAATVANAEELARLKEQIRKLQQLVASGESPDGRIKELEADLSSKDGLLQIAQGRVTELEKQLAEALKQPKGRKSAS